MIPKTGNPFRPATTASHPASSSETGLKVKEEPRIWQKLEMEDFKSFWKLDALHNSDWGLYISFVISLLSL